MSHKDEMREILFALNLRMGLARDVAEKNAAEAVALLSSRFAGERVYFSSEHCEREERDERIYAAHVWGRVPISVIAERFGIGKTTAADAIRRVRLRFAV